MSIKKILTLQFLVMHAIILPYDWNDKDLQAISRHGLVGTTLAAATYLWATAGDTVQQRIESAQRDLASMPEYEQDFDITACPGEKETQIKDNLLKLNIDCHNIQKTYLQKLELDLVTVQAAYNNLWYKSLYGGKEIAEITRKTYQVKLKIEALTHYLKTHRNFTIGRFIIQDSTALVRRNVLRNSSQLIKAAQDYDAQSNYPLYSYVKKIQQDLASIAILTTDKTHVANYPELAETIAQYGPILSEMKDIITAMELYKTQAFSKLEFDIAQLQDSYKKLELLIKKMEIDIAILKMRQR